MNYAETEGKWFIIMRVSLISGGAREVAGAPSWRRYRRPGAERLPPKGPASGRSKPGRLSHSDLVVELPEPPSARKREFTQEPSLVSNPENRAVPP